MHGIERTIAEGDPREGRRQVVQQGGRGEQMRKGE